MEVEQENINQEINSMTSNFEDKDVHSFAEKFLSILKVVI